MMFHVKQNDSLDDFFEKLERLGVQVNTQQKTWMDKYFHLLKKWAGRSNLISRNDINHIVERHFAPCVFMNTCLPGKRVGRIIDVGTGAGLPGLILKIFNPGLRVVLLDSNNKKILFLKEVVDALNIDLELFNQRIEDHINGLECSYDLVVNRAVSNLTVLWKWAQPILTENGKMISIKGEDVEQESAPLIEKSINVKIISPENAWAEFYPGLKNKRVVIVEN